MWTLTTFFTAEKGNFVGSSGGRGREVVKGAVGFCAKETPNIKVVVAFVTFGIIVQFLFLLAGAR